MVHWWSSGIRCILQNTSWHLHSMPSNPTFLLQVEQRLLSTWITDNSTCLTSTAGTSGWGMLTWTAGSSSFLEFLATTPPLLFLSLEGDVLVTNRTQPLRWLLSEEGFAGDAGLGGFLAVIDVHLDRKEIVKKYIKTAAFLAIYKFTTADQNL